MQNYSKYIGIGLQLSTAILAGIFLGYWLDKKFAIAPFGILGGSILGFVAGFYGFFRQIKENDDR
jgi:F0F1-type ATP synthase assembly protein I